MILFIACVVNCVTFKEKLGRNELLIMGNLLLENYFFGYGRIGWLFLFYLLINYQSYIITKIESQYKKSKKDIENAVNLQT